MHDCEVKENCNNEMWEKKVIRFHETTSKMLGLDAGQIVELEI